MGAVGVSAGFLPGASAIHRLDPRAKVLAAAVLTAGLFVGQSLAGVAIVLAVTCAVLAVSQVGAQRAWILVRPLVPLMVLISAAQFLVGAPEVTVVGDQVVQSPTAQAAMLVMRLLAMALLAFLVTSTTAAMDVAFALERLFAPLRLVRLPVADMALLFALAIGFVPMMAAELERLQQAQAARGARARGFAPRMRLRLRIAVIVPLVVLAFRRARHLAEAMRVRGFARGARRTRFREYHLGAGDLAVVALAITVATAAVLV